MIRAIVRDGMIRPTDPMPPEWINGQQVIVEDAQPTPAEDLDEWYRELKELGPAQYKPGEWETVQSILREADEQAKAVVRQQMGSG
jgi:hypothetical protein